MVAFKDYSMVTVNIGFETHSECFGSQIDHVMLQVSQDSFMMDVVVDANWTGEDEPALWEDWTDESNSPAISGVQAIDVPYDLFDEWDPQNENGNNVASVSDPVLSKDPEQDDDDMLLRRGSVF